MPVSTSPITPVDTLGESSLPAFTVPQNTDSIGTAPGDTTPVVCSALTMTANLMIPTINRNAVRVDALARTLGWGVLNGLAFSNPSLGVLGIAAGHILLDGVWTLAATTLALSAGVVNTIWALPSDTLQFVAQHGTGALTPPQPRCVYLGSVTTDGTGLITSVDTSGVLYPLMLSYRKTASTGVPTDTPPAGLLLLTRNLSGLWLWDGAAWSQTVPPGAGKPARLVAGTITITTTSTSLPFTHNLNSYDVQVSVWTTGSPRTQLLLTLAHTLPDANTVSINTTAGQFSPGTYRVVVTG